MSNWPTPDLIKKSTNVKNLQDVCLTLLKVAEKERSNKIKYRNSANIIRQEADALKLEYKCIKEKNDSLIQCLQNNQNSEKLEQSENHAQESKESQEKLNEMVKQNLELEKTKIELEYKIKEYTSEIQELQNKNKQIEQNYNNLMNEKESSDLKLKSCEEKITLLQSHLSQIQIASKTADNNDLLQEQLKKLTEENARLSRNSNEIDKLMIEIKELKEKHLAEVNQLQNDNKELSQKINQLESQAKLSEISLQTLNLETKTKSSEFNRILNENSSLKENLATLKNTLQEYEKKINQFEISNQQLSNDQKALVAITEENKNKAKERIKKLQLVNIQLEEDQKAEIEKLNLEHNKKINELEETIKGLQEKKVQSSEQNKEKLTKIRNQKAKLKEKLELFRQEIEKLRAQTDELQIKLHDTNTQNEVMLQKITEFEKVQDNTEELKNQNAGLNTKIQKLNLEIYELKEKIQENSNFSEAVSDKDQMINKLKNQLQIYIKTDKEKSEKIKNLQDEISELTSKFGSFSSTGVGPSGSVDELIKIEREKADLEEKIKNSQASQEMVKKNQKLTILLEKSNKLYIQLKQENDLLKKKLSRIQQPTLSNFSQVICDIFINSMHDSQGSTQRTNKKTIAESKKTKEEKKMAQNAYLRRVLLQFFTEEEKNRAALIPIILKLVYCTDAQISAAVRQWERSSHLIYGLFGF